MLGSHCPMQMLRSRQPVGSRSCWRCGVWHRVSVLTATGLGTAYRGGGGTTPKLGYPGAQMLCTRSHMMTVLQNLPYGCQLTQTLASREMRD